MDKKIKLAVLGLIVFVIISGFFIILFSGKPSQSTDNTQHILLTPYFIKEYFKNNPDYRPSTSKPVALANLFNPTLKKLSASENGFSLNELVINNSAALIITNTSNKVLNFVVTSPGMDGTSYSLSQFAISPDKKISLDLLIPPYMDDIASKSKMEKTDKGILVFEISCTNCNETSNYLKVYAKVS